MANGLSFESFAAVIDVNQDTLYQWVKDKRPGFSEAKEAAFAKCRLFWEQKGIDGLWTSTYRKGNISTTKAMNARIWELNMKARFKEWKNAEKADTEDQSNAPAPQLIINVNKG